MKTNNIYKFMIAAVACVLFGVSSFTGCSNDEWEGLPDYVPTLAPQLTRAGAEGNGIDIDFIPVEENACAAWALATLLKESGYILPGKNKPAKGYQCYNAVCSAANNNYKNMTNIQIRQVASKLNMGLQNEHWILHINGPTLNEIQLNDSVNTFISQHGLESGWLLLTNDPPLNHTSIITGSTTADTTVIINGVTRNYTKTKIKVRDYQGSHTYNPSEIYLFIY